MKSSKNSWELLTSPGSGAIQIIQVHCPDQVLVNKFEQHFEPTQQSQSSLRLGVLRDQDEIIEEVFFERDSQGIRIHFHANGISLKKISALLEGLGCAPHLKATHPESLEEEIFWALRQAKTTRASQVAVQSFELLSAVTQLDMNLLETFSYGQSLFQPSRYLLVGAPNAGKSSLINRVLGRERVAVSAQAGTTRDLVEVTLEVEGRQVILVDAAGLGPTEDIIEKEGQSWLLHEIKEYPALWIVDPHQPISPCPVSQPHALVLTHMDLGKGHEPSFDGPKIYTQLNDAGQSLLDFLKIDLPKSCEGPIIFTSRQKEVIEKALESGQWNQKDWLGSSQFPAF